jgi:membrane fusion protein (multidrug efflux system)
MKKPVLVLACLLAATITFGPGRHRSGKREEEAQKAKPVPVWLSRRRKSPLPHPGADGRRLHRQARLASPGEGPIQNCRVREGDQVNRGQRLVTIGRSGAAAAQVTAAAESVKEQQAELNRTNILVQSGAVPGSQLDTARAKYEGARALLAKARELAGDYSVAAPWDGVVSKVLVKDGDFVAPRAPLVEMYDPHSLVIRSVPEAQSTGFHRHAG